MKSSLQELSTLERRLQIEVPVEHIQKSYERIFKSLQGQVQIKGFRKGKAPLSTIKSMYKERVTEDVVKDLIQVGFVSALKEHNLEPLGEPTFEFDHFHDHHSFTFTADFEVPPKVEIRHYQGLEVPIESLVVDESQVQEVLENFAKEKKTFSTVFENRSLASGDQAVFDFKGFVNEDLLPGGSAEKFELEIGSGQFIPGFEEGLVGMKPGDSRTLNLKFPDDYHAKDIAGQPVRFEVTLHEIRKPETPNLDDEFAKSVWPGVESLEGLKDRIRAEIENRERSRIEDEFKNRLLKKLTALNPVEVPPSLFKKQKEMLIEDFKGRMKNQGMTPQQIEDYISKWDHDFNATANQMIQTSFLITELASKLNMGVEAADMDSKLQEIAERARVDMAKVREFYSKPEQFSRLRFQVIEEKVVGKLISEAIKKEVKAEEIASLEGQSL